ncbi:MAG: response regulator transcription factor [Cytophagales bacterium]|nr:response regulator transcription factor [Cytophagales bacterium]
MPTPFINVALVEDEPATHERLLAALATDPHIQVLFSTNAAKPMLQWLVGHMDTDNLNVLLVDLGLPDLHGLEVIRLCKAMKPKVEIMVITMFGDETNMIRAFEAGASGYLLKDGNESELAEHVRTLRDGGSPMSPIIARQLLSRMGGGLTAKALTPEARVVEPMVRTLKTSSNKLLTEREETVLQFLSRGYTYGELAKEMGVTINTIQSHIRGLYAKLEVHSRSEAIFEAKQLGLLDA